jgi:UDPglucose--hexose-1-phosphate uridylyltransferase
MSDFDFRKHPGTGKPVILAPRRSRRTNTGKKPAEVCPFCIGGEAEDAELYRVGGSSGDSNWKIRVIPNKFPFTPHHELIIHSPDHHKNFDELPFEQVELIFETYRQRFKAHESHGQVYIFHNRGHAAGESLPHPHTQITVVPNSVKLDILPLDMGIYAQIQSSKFKVQNYNSKLKRSSSKKLLTFNFKLLTSSKKVTPTDLDFLETDHFLIFCPATSDWPDELWVTPKSPHGLFGSLADKEVTDLAFVVSRLIQVFDMRHGYEFPFNFYISPGRNWYLRLIPRLKILGGFELGTNIIVNTQDPKETLAFLKEHFWRPNAEKIKGEHKAEYLKSV